MTTPELRDRRIVTLLEEAICTHELTLTCKLAAGAEYVAEEAALAELYRRLQIAHHFQTHRAKQSFNWLSHFS